MEGVVKSCLSLLVLFFGAKFDVFLMETWMETWVWKSDFCCITLCLQRGVILSYLFLSFEV